MAAFLIVDLMEKKKEKRLGSLYSGAVKIIDGWPAAFLLG